MGQVFLARDLAFDDRLVALKLLLPDFLDETADFMREYVLQRQLHHPAIPSVHDFGFGQHQAGEVPYFVMDYVRGVPLARAMRRLKRLSDAWPWMLQVLRALDCLHEKRYLHRDLKPSNILVREDGNPDDCAWLIDFGISIGLDAEPEELFIGTPEYSAPELMAGDPFDVRQDLYAFGLLLYELIAGRRPWPQEDPTKLWEVRTYGKLPKLENRFCPPAVITLVESLLAPRVSNRPRSAAVVIEELASAVGLGTEIEPPSAFRMRLASLPFGNRGTFETAARDWHAGLRVDIGDGERPAILVVDNPPGYDGQLLLHELTDRGAVGGARVVRLNLVGRSQSPLEALEPALKVFRRLRERRARDTGMPAIPLHGLAGAATMLTRLHGPTVLTIEGLQRADAHTLELLKTVFEGAANPMLRVVATIDPTEPPIAPEQLEAVLGAKFTHRTGLDPLTLADTSEWITQAIGDEVLPDADVERLHEHSEGRPLRLLALLGDAYERGALVRTSEGYDRAAQGHRAPASDHVPTIEELLSALRHHYPADALRTYLAEHADDLARLIADGQLVRHPSGLLGVRDVVAARRRNQQLLRSVRTSLHVRLAEAIRGAAAFEDQHAAVARELLMTTEPIAATPFLVAAANDAASALKPHAAGIHLERAQALLDEHAAATDPQLVWRFRVLVCRTSVRLAKTTGDLAAWRSGATDLLTLGEEGSHMPTMHEAFELLLDYDVATSAWPDLVDHAKARRSLETQPPQPDGDALLAWAIAQRDWALGQVEPALQRLNTVLAGDRTALKPSVKLRIMALRAEILTEAHWIVSAKQAVSDYEALAARVGDLRDQALSRLLHARNMRHAQDPDEALRIVRQLTSELGDRHLRGISGQIELELAQCHITFAWLTTALDHADRARSLAERDSDPGTALRARLVEARGVALSGHVEDAAELLADVIEDVHPAAHSVLRHEIVYARLEIALALNDGAGAAEVMEQADAFAAGAKDRQLRGVCVRGLALAARAATAAEMPEKAVRYAQSALHTAGHYGGVGWPTNYLLYIMARARQLTRDDGAIERARAERPPGAPPEEAWMDVPIYDVVASGEIVTPGKGLRRPDGQTVGPY